MRINNNIMALNTHRQFSVNNESVSKATEKLSSGFRINRAGDDAAGLAISEKMRAQIRGLEMAAKNSQDAISLVQTAEGALTETHAILQSMRELAVQASSDTNENLVDRAALDAVFQQLKEEIDDIANQTKFNDMHLLDGRFGSVLGVESHDDLTNVASVEIAGAKAGDEITFVKFDKITAGTDYVEATHGGSVDGTKFTDDNGFVYAYDTGEDKIGELIGFAGDLEGLDITKADFDTLEDGSVLVVQKRNHAEEGAEADWQIEGYVRLSSSDLAGQEGVVDLTKAGITLNLNESESLTIGDEPVTITVGEVKGSGGQIQTGANEGDNLRIEISDMSAGALGLNEVNGEGSDVSITNRDDAEKAVTAVNTAINKVSTQRANLGAYQNRLEHKINNLNTSAENLQAAESRIRDLDIAKEMTAFTRNSILVQASTAMLAQANSAPQAVLSLLR